VLAIVPLMGGRRLSTGTKQISLRSAGVPYEPVGVPARWRTLRIEAVANTIPEPRLSHSSYCGREGVKVATGHSVNVAARLTVSCYFHDLPQ
jgi:hypothetical protein